MNKRDTRNFDRFIQVHKTTGPRTLYDCYKKPSIYKELAYALCKEQCLRYEGKGFTVISYECFAFSVGFIVKQGPNVTFFFITACNEFVSKLDEEQIERCKKAGIKI
jgi:hypothetical protein